jgi:methylated-DNA-protein-cysteine methyltransferase-like protein
MVMNTKFYQQALKILKRIPPGRVATYGQIALYAGDPGGARKVAWLLHSSSEKENLPWQRVINHQGGISLKPGAGFEQQKALLLAEGVRSDRYGKINLQQYLWKPKKSL